MNLTDLLEKQKKLDKLIFKNSGIERYPFEDIKLALLTELGELGNEVQSFKYWKRNKNIKTERILEEFADCLHFALSLENYLGQTSDVVKKEPDDVFKIVEKKSTNEEINRVFLRVYDSVILKESILVAIITLGKCLGLTLEIIQDAYLKKYNENVRRQEEGY